MLSVYGEKPNAPDISRKSIAEMFPPTKPGYTTLLWQPNQETEKRCIQNAEHMESSLAYIGC